MRRMTGLIVVFALALPAVGQLVAAEVPATAKVLKINGTTAQVILPGESVPRGLTPGEDLPQGATVITGAGTEVYLQPMGGAVATIRPNTRVELEQLSVTTEGSAVTKQSAPGLAAPPMGKISPKNVIKKDPPRYWMPMARGNAPRLRIKDKNAVR